jgi:hypothetical protein
MFTHYYTVLNIRESTYAIDFANEKSRWLPIQALVLAGHRSQNCGEAVIAAIRKAGIGDFF